MFINSCCNCNVVPDDPLHPHTRYQRSVKAAGFEPLPFLRDVFRLTVSSPLYVPLGGGNSLLVEIRSPGHGLDCNVKAVVLGTYENPVTQRDTFKIDTTYKSTISHHAFGRLIDLFLATDQHMHGDHRDGVEIALECVIQGVYSARTYLFGDHLPVSGLVRVLRDETFPNGDLDAWLREKMQVGVCYIYCCEKTRYERVQVSADHEAMLRPLEQFEFGECDPLPECLSVGRTDCDKQRYEQCNIKLYYVVC